MTRKNYNKFFSKESKDKMLNDQEVIKVGQGGFAKALKDESSEKKIEEIKMEPQSLIHVATHAGDNPSARTTKSESTPSLNVAFTEMQVAKCSFLNVREAPDVNAKVVGKIKRDAIVHVLVNDGGWSKIFIPGNRIERYVKSEFLTLRKGF